MIGPAVLCAAAAAALWCPRPARLAVRAGDPARAGAPALVLLGLVVAGVVSGLPPQAVALVALAGLVAAAVAALWRRRGARRRAAAVRHRVLECCEQLAGELATGRPPGAALAHAAEAWTPLAPVAEAFRVGSDVPESLRGAARVPGAADLRLLAAAWQVSHRTGQGLAEAVDRVAGEIRAAGATRRIVDGELASARATARLVAALPVAALAMGSGAGGDPWAFLVGRPAGLACLAGGLGLGFAGLWWIEAIAQDVDRGS